MEADVKDRKSTATLNRSNEREGKVARTIEKETARIPSDVYLWASIGAMVASLVLKILNKGKTALFIGQWAPSLLIIGLYNKLVKQEGHDKHD